ncbi:MAG: hypothetical protein U0Y68_18565 [Blastocatellia bacterium]
MPESRLAGLHSDANFMSDCAAPFARDGLRDFHPLRLPVGGLMAALAGVLKAPSD